MSSGVTRMIVFRVVPSKRCDADDNPSSFTCAQTPHIHLTPVAFIILSVGFPAFYDAAAGSDSALELSFEMRDIIPKYKLAQNLSQNMSFTSTTVRSFASLPCLPFVKRPRTDLSKPCAFDRLEGLQPWKGILPKPPPIQICVCQYLSWLQDSHFISYLWTRAGHVGSHHCNPENRKQKLVCLGFGQSTQELLPGIQQAHLHQGKRSILKPF